MNYWAAPGLKSIRLYTGVNPLNKRENIIITSVCTFYELSFKEIRQRKRKVEYVLARQMIMTLLRKYTGWSLKAIGSMFDLDHTTVMHALKTIKDRLDTEPQLVNEYAIINHSISQAIA